MKECSLKTYLNDVYGKETRECYLGVFSGKTGKLYTHNLKSILKETDTCIQNWSKEDLYLSLNPTNTIHKSSDARIFSIYHFAVDLDFRNITGNTLAEHTNEEVIELLLHEISNLSVRIPIPNYIESGRNIRLIYSFNKPIKLTKKASVKQRKFVNRLKTVIEEEIEKADFDFGVDRGQALSSYIRSTRFYQYKIR